MKNKKYICIKETHMCDWSVEIGDTCIISATGKRYNLIYCNGYNEENKIEIRFEDKISKKDFNHYFTDLKTTRSKWLNGK